MSVPHCPLTWRRSWSGARTCLALRTSPFSWCTRPRHGRRISIAFGTALQQKLTAAPLIRAVVFGYSPALLAALDHVTLAYAPLFVRSADLEDFDRLLTPEGLRAQIQKTLLTLSLPGTGRHEQWLLADPLQLRRFALARLTALRGTFRFDPTSPIFYPRTVPPCSSRWRGRPRCMTR